MNSNEDTLHCAKLFPDILKRKTSSLRSFPFGFDYMTALEREGLTTDNTYCHNGGAYLLLLERSLTRFSEHFFGSAAAYRNRISNPPISDNSHQLFISNPQFKARFDERADRDRKRVIDVVSQRISPVHQGSGTLRVFDSYDNFHCMELTEENIPIYRNVRRELVLAINIFVYEMSSDNKVSELYEMFQQGHALMSYQPGDRRFL